MWQMKVHLHLKSGL